jgi:hypothetical protein
MLVDDKIEIKITRRVKKYYTDLGYDVPNEGCMMKIYTKDLSNGSVIKVKCKCQVCGKIKTVFYKKYVKSIKEHGYYSCYGICSKDKIKKLG